MTTDADMMYLSILQTGYSVTSRSARRCVNITHKAQLNDCDTVKGNFN